MQLKNPLVSAKTKGTEHESPYEKNTTRIEFFSCSNYTKFQNKCKELEEKIMAIYD